MTQANQMAPMPTVNRSRFRSATEEPPSELDTPPPNMSDRPPPRPLCRRTSTTSRKLVSMSRMVKSRVTVENPTSRIGQSEQGHVVEPADPGELVHLEARTAHQAAVDIIAVHDPRDVRGLHRTAVEDAYAVGRCVPVDVTDPLADGGADLLRVVGRGDLAGADGPDGFVGDDK